MFRIQRRWLRVVLAGAVALSLSPQGARPLFAQEDVNLDEFEGEISPELEELEPAQPAQPRLRGEQRAPVQDQGGPQFEEFRPQVEELEVPEGATQPLPESPLPPAAPAPTPSGTAPAPAAVAPPPAPVPPPLPATRLQERRSVPKPPAPKPVAEPPTIEPPPSTPAPVRVRTQTKLPRRKISLDADFEQQLRELNQQISLLKEKVIEAKSRLLSYSQKVAQGFASGTQIFIRIDNHLGSDFLIEKIVFYLDGHQIFTREFEPGEEVAELLVYKGTVLPGRHRLDVDAILHGDEGIFDFDHSARLRLESGEYLVANEGKIVELDLVLFDRGGAFTAVDQRPGLKFEIRERDVF